MSDTNTLNFIEQTLDTLSEEFHIPDIIIPQLVGLLKKYPDTTIRGTKKKLRDELEMLIENVKNEGTFN